MLKAFFSLVHRGRVRLRALASAVNLKSKFILAAVANPASNTRKVLTPATFTGFRLSAIDANNPGAFTVNAVMGSSLIPFWLTPESVKRHCAALSNSISLAQFSTGQTTGERA